MVECGGLENRCLARGREFESHPLRQIFGEFSIRLIAILWLTIIYLDQKVSSWPDKVDR